MLSEVCHLQPKIRYISPLTVTGATLISFSDGYHGSNSSAYEQTGVIFSIRLSITFDEEPLVHSIYRTSTKQCSVTYSSFGAEILACSDADNQGFEMKTKPQNIFWHGYISHRILLVSKALFDIINTIHECRELRLHRTVNMIKNAFESRERDTLTWIAGSMNIADASTKQSVNQSKKNNESFADGHLTINIFNGMIYHSAIWS